MSKNLSTGTGLKNISIYSIIECLGAMQQDERLKRINVLLRRNGAPDFIVTAVEQAVDNNRSFLDESLRKKLEDLGVSASKDFAKFEA